MKLRDRGTNYRQVLKSWLPITFHFAATLIKRRRTPGSPWSTSRGKQRRTEHQRSPTFAFQLGSILADLHWPLMLVSNARWTTSIHTFDPHPRERYRDVGMEGQWNSSVEFPAKFRERRVILSMIYSTILEIPGFDATRNNPREFCDYDILVIINFSLHVSFFFFPRYFEGILYAL